MILVPSAQALLSSDKLEVGIASESLCITLLVPVYINCGKSIIIPSLR